MLIRANAALLALFVESRNACRCLPSPGESVSGDMVDCSPGLLEPLAEIGPQS